MKINRNNYEIFFIDFYDGKLTEMQKLEMDVFLKSNPDLKVEFEEFENITIDNSDITYVPKHDLKKPEIIEVGGIHEENYEEAFIAWHENDLDADEKVSLLSFIKANPHLEKEFQLHGTLSIPAGHIIFEDKAQLKKKAYIGYYWYGAAAAVLIFLALNIFLNQNKPVQPLNRFEVVRAEKATIAHPIKPNPSNQFMVHYIDERTVLLPAPEPFEKETIQILASVGLPGQVLKQQMPVYLINREYTAEIFLVADVEHPKKRGLLAQFFRKNVEEVTQELGIDDAMAAHSDKKKDPGFVKFLDGSLTVFNTITGSDAELVKNYDNQGNLKNYSLEGQSFVVNRKLPAGKSSD